ncbi:MAG: AAA family ATPase [Mycoplasmataceae bacterium]|nr:AAA family ATPase [Mycoplasmataceae bacterium]
MTINELVKNVLAKPEWKHLKITSEEVKHYYKHFSIYVDHSVDEDGMELIINRNANNKLTFIKKESLNSKDPAKNIRHHLLFNEYFSDQDLHLRLTRAFFETDNGRGKLLQNLSKVCKNFNKTTNGWYVYGTYGIGKTRCFKAFCNNLVIQNQESSAFSIAYISMNELVQLFKDSWDTSESLTLEQDLIAKLKYATILILDEIGAEINNNKLGWFYTKLYSVLDYRLTNRKISFFIANYSLSTYETKLKYAYRENYQRFIERIKGLINNQQIELDGKNLRNV